MTRKSAAKAKAIKTNNSDKFLKQPELPPIEETFDKAKQAFVNTAEVSVVLAGQPRNLVNLRNAAHSFWDGELANKFTSAEKVQYFKDLLDMSVETYEQVLDTVKSFELDEFLKEEMKDYFLPLMPTIRDIETEDDIFRASIIDDIIRPFGEKMTSLHHTMLDEKAQREAIERLKDE